MSNFAKCLFLFINICFVVTLSFAQITPAIQTAQAVQTSAPAVRNAPSALDKGIALYGEGKWQDAIAELRKAEEESAIESEKAEIFYWIALAEMGAGEYENALTDLDEAASSDSASALRLEASYQKGRCLYYLGEYDEAIIVLKDYSDAVLDPMKKASAFYWLGESLFSMGQFQLASDVFYRIIDEFPESVKYEAANYRIALINQKKVEAELLAILKWSHEESLKTVEAYQRRERSYDQAIIAYQKRISDMQKSEAQSE